MILLLLPSCFLPPSYFATLLPCYLATLLPCYFATLLPCYFATFLPPSYFAILLPCYFATLLHCSLATLLNCYLATVLHCYFSALLLPLLHTLSCTFFFLHFYLFPMWVACIMWEVASFAFYFHTLTSTSAPVNFCILFYFTAVACTSVIITASQWRTFQFFVF